MRGIAIRQPYASLIAFGAQTLLLTASRVEYRGKIAIVAVKPKPTTGEPDYGEILVHEQPACFFLEPYGYDSLYKMPTGVVVARASVAGCLPKCDRVVQAALARHPFTARVMPDSPRLEWALILTHIESIKPEIVQPPNYGLFEIPPERAQEILATPLI